jgi:hypothetical protein
MILPNVCISSNEPRDLEKSHLEREKVSQFKSLLSWGNTMSAWPGIVALCSSWSYLERGKEYK